jgi:hypothetical protein
MRFKPNRSNRIHQASGAGGFLFLFFFVFPSLAFAQAFQHSDEMPRDERGKYIHYEVVENRTVPTDSLKARAIAFIALKKMKSVRNDSSGIVAAGQFIIIKTALMLAHPSGELQYNFTFEMKEQKYRFWLTDFLFIPYKRDRYGNFVPSNPIGKALEDNPGKLNAGEWASYVDAARKQSAVFASQFKASLNTLRKGKTPAIKKKVISTKSW